MRDVVPLQGLPDRSPILRALQVQHVLGDDKSAKHSDEVGDDGQQRQDHGCRNHSGRHQLLNRVGPQRAHGVDLLGHLHRPQFAGDSGRVAAGHQKRGQHGAQFAHQGDRHHLPGSSHLPVLRQRARHLQGQHRAAEKTGENHDGKAAYSDSIHLDENVIRIMRAAKDVAERGAGKYIKILNCQERLFQEIQQT